MLFFIIHIILIKTSVYHWRGRQFLKWLHILGGKKSHYNDLTTPQHLHMFQGQRNENHFKSFQRSADLGDTVRQEYCKFSEHQLLPESSTLISFKQFALRMSSFLRRLFKNLFKKHVFFLKERLIFICNVHTDIPPGK